MTNAHSNETPLEGWRAEIRTFCDDVREQLSTIRKKIEAEQKHQDIGTSEPSDEVLCDQQPAIRSSTLDSRSTVDSRDGAKLPTAESADNETADRLQHVRRQLQAMLSANGEP